MSDNTCPFHPRLPLSHSRAWIASTSLDLVSNYSRLVKACLKRSLIE